MATFFAAVKRHVYGEAEERKSIRSILLGPPGAGKGNALNKYLKKMSLVLSKWLLYLSNDIIKIVTYLSYLSLLRRILYWVITSHNCPDSSNAALLLFHSNNELLFGQLYPLTGGISGNVNR